MLEDKNQSRTSLDQLGEFGLIHHITKHFKISHKTTVKAVGDDSAVLESSEKQTIAWNKIQTSGQNKTLYFACVNMAAKLDPVNWDPVNWESS